MRKSTKIFVIFDLLIILAFGLLYMPATREKIEKKISGSLAGAIIYGNEVKTAGNIEVQLDGESIKKMMEEPESVTRITIVSTGDSLIHNTVYNTHKTSDGYDFNDIFDNVRSEIQQYDLAYYNQETILGGAELGLSNYPQFNSPQEVGDAFVAAGFNLVSLANNHTLDGRYRYGDKALENSRAYWDRWYESDGIIATGSWLSWEERNKVVIGEVKGVTYGLLSYTTLDNMLHNPKGREYLNNMWDEEVAKADIAAYRDKVDVLIVAMHWGVDYVHTPNASQKHIAQFLADNGVDIVFGCHAHYIQPIEMIGDTLVYYGLGNFVGAQNERTRKDSMTGMLGFADIVVTRKDGKTKVSFENVGAQLVYCSRKQNFKIIPYTMLKSSDTYSGANVTSEFARYSEVLRKYWSEVIVR